MTQIFASKVCFSIAELQMIDQDRCERRIGLSLSKLSKETLNMFKEMFKELKECCCAAAVVHCAINWCHQGAGTIAVFV